MISTRQLFIPLVFVVSAASFAMCTPTNNASNGEGSSGASTVADAQAPETPDAAPEATEDAAAPSAESVDAAVTAQADAAPAVQWLGARTFALRPGARVSRGTNPAHGSTAWTVVVAVASRGTPELQALSAQLTRLRYAAALGEINCTQSAGEPYPATFPSGGEAMMVSVSFRNEREARAFAAALTEQPAWVGRAQIRCAD
ncbi:MAG: hypothetical protein JNK05_30500 [Myxococcales bacterium]|nr:hypothetical protein [Myxococcales bacterium]